MKIQVICTEQQKCTDLFAKTKELLDELEMEAELSCLSDTAKMTELNLEQGPVLVIDGEVALSTNDFTEENLKKVLLSKFSPVSGGCSGCSGCGCGS